MYKALLTPNAYEDKFIKTAGINRASDLSDRIVCPVFTRNPIVQEQLF